MAGVQLGIPTESWPECQSQIGLVSALLSHRAGSDTKRAGCYQSQMPPVWEAQ